MLSFPARHGDCVRCAGLAAATGSSDGFELIKAMTTPDVASPHSVSTDSDHAVTLDEVITTIIMARVTEFFGFFVYGIASVLVFPRVFFPGFDPVTGTMLSFLVFSLAFLVRPGASLFARQVDRRMGRVAKVVLALFIFGAATLSIGLLPSYEAIGVAAPLLLIILRIGQGIGQGMSWDGLPLKLQHEAPRGRKNWYAMLPQLGGPLGFITAAAIYYVLTGFLTEEEFIKWGWRFPFFAVLAVNVVSLFARVRLINSTFSEQNSFRSAPLQELIEKQWQPILRSTFIPLTSYALFHLVTIFPLGYIILYQQRPIEDILLMQMIGGVVAIATMLFAGTLADRIGRRRLMMVQLLFVALFSLAVSTLETNSGWFIIVGFALFGLGYGQAAAITPGRFLPEFQYSGSALATNLSWIFGAAFAPLAALAFTNTLGLWSVAIYLLSGVVVSVISLVAVGRDKMHGKQAG